MRWERLSPALCCRSQRSLDKGIGWSVRPLPRALHSGRAERSIGPAALLSSIAGLMAAVRESLGRNKEKSSVMSGK